MKQFQVVTLKHFQPVTITVFSSLKRYSKLELKLNSSKTLTTLTLLFFWNCNDPSCSKSHLADKNIEKLKTKPLADNFLRHHNHTTTH